MSNIIKVVVDLPLRKLNKEYDYLIPENLAGEIEVGQIVKVPFGRRKIAAFVTKIKAEADIEKDKIKEQQRKKQELLWKDIGQDKDLHRKGRESQHGKHRKHKQQSGWKRCKEIYQVAGRTGKNKRRPSGTGKHKIRDEKNTRRRCTELW